MDNLDLDCLLGYITGHDRTWLYAHPEITLNKNQKTKLNQLIKRRLKGEPIAYLLGHKEFFGLDFIVNKHTLIPRPETELLVEEVLSTQNITTIADIGTGSGCIAIVLAQNRPDWKIYATDISSDALRVARKNSLKNKTEIIFKKGNLLQPVKNINLDAIVANLPYVPNPRSNQKTNTYTRGLKFEPKNALYAGRDGLNLFKQFFQQIKIFDLHPKYIYLEIGHNQADAIKKLTNKYLPIASVKIKTDLAKQDRLAIITIP